MCTRWALGENWVRINISFLLGWIGKSRNVSKHHFYYKQSAFYFCIRLQIMFDINRWDAERSHGSLTRYVKLPVAHAPWMRGTFSPPPGISDPDMNHGTCVGHVPWCILGSLTSGFLWSRLCNEAIFVYTLSMTVITLFSRCLHSCQ